MERGLDAPECDGASNRRFHESGQGLALLQYGFELGAQLGLDADLGYHSGLHERSVLRLLYGHGSGWLPPGRCGVNAAVVLA
jgi:hypothetical protein